ncbi:helix-turn-helix domain-containing protein [Halanaeroarchaeum sp. HSR-CO]|uniref:helix-turn-helix domain-containing protein n=1 Tax=Halanaeroarchaeum sp. HSR-CO TaxID=2866382 RepID=UPI00217CCBCB|nr:helix-turn-helix domain-containing protein [Halanaeroarchaeum sp. HSR-CO]
MPRATLTITVPGTVWIGAISREYPDARFRILSAIPGEDTGVGLVEITASTLSEVVQAVDETTEVEQLNLLKRHEDTALVQFETTDPLLLFPIMSSGIPLEMPFDIVDGKAVWEVTTSQDRLSELGDQLDAFGIQFTVEEIHYHLQTEQLLTERQESLVDRAIELGYYDTPRECTLTELAEDVGLAKSTCSETLHRAEGKIVKEFQIDDGR